MAQARLVGLRHITRAILMVGVAAAFLLLPVFAHSDDAASALKAKAEKIHQTHVILDGHADIALPSTSKLYLGSDGLSNVALSKLRAGGVGAVVLSVAVPPGARDAEGAKSAQKFAEAKLSAVEAMAAQNPDAVVIATSASDIIEAKNAGKTAVILGFQNARSLGGDLSGIDHFYDEGVRVFAMNHIGHNAFADSSRPHFYGDIGGFEPAEEHNGLSALGRAAVKRLNQLGVVIDVSQTSKVGTLQILRLSEAPVIASHSNARALSDVARNLSDEEIDLIGEKGGVIHVAAFAAYLVNYADPKLKEGILDARRAAGLPDQYTYPYELYWEIKDEKKKLGFLMSVRDLVGASSVSRMVDHIDYIVDRIGIDHVGIGNDFNHGGGVSDFSEAHQAHNLTIALLERGYSEEDIAKIWGGNFLRVMEGVERRAQQAKALALNN